MLYRAQSQLISIIVNLDAANARTDTNNQLPPVMQHELVNHSPSCFCAIAYNRINRMSVVRFTPQHIEQFVEDYREFT